jgi:predicted  nucleic acid-binding Zn-ribbon protein
MNQHLIKLIDLSKFDNEIDDYEEKITKVKESFEYLQAKRNDILAETEKLKEHIKTIDGQIKGFENQLTKFKNENLEHEKKLREVKKDKELKALKEEAETRYTQMIKANDKIIELDKERDIKIEDLKELEKELNNFNVKVKKAEQNIEVFFENIKQNKNEILRKREELNSRIEKNVCDFYAKIRQWAKKTTLVKMANGICYGCFLKLNDQVYLEILKGEDIVTCPNCGRILYYEPQNPSENTEEDLKKKSS